MMRVLFPVEEKTYYRLTRMGSPSMGGYRCPACMGNYGDWLDALKCVDRCICKAVSSGCNLSLLRNLSLSWKMAEVPDKYRTKSWDSMDDGY